MENQLPPNIKKRCVGRRCGKQMPMTVSRYALQGNFCVACGRAADRRIAEKKAEKYKE